MVNSQDSNEPVAWMFSDPKNPKMRFVEWQKETKSYMGEWIKTPLYTAPPQRKPLSASDLRVLYDRHAKYQEEGPEASGWWDFARSVEQAHNIKE